jgi:hypothetical protein
MEFERVIHDYLRPLRDEIAHVIDTDSGEPTMMTDHLPHLEKVDRWLGVTKCIARWMLKQDFPDEYLIYLNDRGNVEEDKVKIFGARPESLGPPD